MLKKIAHLSILCLTFILWPSCGYTMWEEDDGDSLPPVAPFTWTKNQESSNTNPKTQLSECKILKSSILPLEKNPIHYEFLLIKYNYSDQYISDLKWYGEYKNKNYRTKPTQSLEVQTWQKEWNRRCETYKRLHKDYKRSLNTTNTELQNKRKSAFQPVLEVFLRRQGSEETIHRLNKIKESDKDFTNTDLYVVFGDEFKRIEKQLIFNDKTWKKTDSSSKKVDAFALDLTDITPAIQRLRRLIDVFKKEQAVQDDVILAYNRDYLPETSSTWSSQQWNNWWEGNIIGEVKSEIKKSIEEDFPYGVYSLCLMGKNPSLEALGSIQPRQLAVYAQDEDLFIKVKEKDETRIIQTEITCTAGLGLKIFERLINLCLTKEEGVLLKQEDQWALMDYASISGYLPNDFSVEDMSRLKKDRKEVLDILLDKGWIFEDGIWKKRVGERKREDNKIVPIALEENKLFLQNWQPYYTNNTLFSTIDKNINPQIKSKPIVKLAEIGENGKIIHKEYPETINLKDLQLNQYKPDDQELITSEIILVHHQKMAETLNHVNKNIKTSSDKKYESNFEELELYNELYNEFENILINSRELEFQLDKPYSWLIHSPGLLYYYLPNISYIPTRRTFFASDDPYGTQQPLQKIDLSSCNLSDENFFKENRVADDTDRAPDVEKTRKNGKNLFTDYTHIILSNNNLKGKKTLSFPINLEILDLSKNNLTSLNILQVGKDGLPHLRVLDLSFNNLESCSTLTDRKSLIRLNLSYNNISNIQPICDNLTLLRVLDLSGNKKLFADPTKREETFSAIEDLHLLENLTIADCGLTGDFNKLFPEEFKLSKSFIMDKLYVLDIRKNPNILYPTEKNDLRKIFPKLKEVYTDTLKINWQ